MKPLIPGYKYELAHRDGAAATVLQFVERKPEAKSIIAASADGRTKTEAPRKMETVVDGVTTEEVIAALLHRTIHLQALLPSVDNLLVAHHLELALTCLANRTNDRTKRGVEGTAQL